MRQEDREYVGAVTLMLLGDGLNPDEVSSELGLVPSQCWRKGEKKSFLRADGTTRVFDSEHEWGGWKMLIPPEHKDDLIESQLEFWVDLLQSRIMALKRFRLLAFHCALDIFITSSETASIVIPHNLLTEVAALGVDLQWSFSAYSESEQAAAGDARNART
jgi:hypothetical protein